MKHFKKYIKKYIGLFLIAVTLLVVEALCELIQPTIMADLIDVGVADKDINYILYTGGLMLGITFIGAIVAVARSIVSTKVSQSFAYDLRNDIFIKINEYSVKNIDKISRASLITRSTNDINQIQQFVHGMMKVFVKAPILCIGSFIIAMKLNFKMSLIILVAIIIIFIVIVINMKIGYKLFKKVQNTTDKVNKQIRQFLGGIKIVKLFGRQDYEVDKFEELNEELFINSSRAMATVAFFRPTITIIINMSIVIILIIGGYSVENGGIKIGVVVAYINYMSRILTSLVMISHILNVFVRAKASYDRLNEVFEVDNNISCKDKVEFSGGDIEFLDVDFSYNEDEIILKNISFKIKQGENIGIIGETGSGKTSLINLISKLYSIDKGLINIGNYNIEDIDEKSLRNNIGLVFQKSSLFGKTVVENITMGNKEITIEDVEKSCIISDAHEFVQKLDNSYLEVLSQGGKNLSGGQKQRLTIARAIVKKPKILILDDCYSAMDISTETKIRKNIKEYINKESILITVSQKISSIIDCDKIIVLDEGCIVGFDTHENLLTDSPTYRDIYELQTIGKEEIN